MRDLNKPAVHPHGCGERYHCLYADQVQLGSSPRVWGTLKNVILLVLIGRFIPTGVGNAQRPRLIPPQAAVHPHGCGERLEQNYYTLVTFGSSPRVWGTRPASSLRFPLRRFIPTGVGNAFYGSYTDSCSAVHPHGCGERAIIDFTNNHIGGSSPRVWGTHIGYIADYTIQRFIPTGVGNAPVAGTHAVAAAVHPHGCGERWTYRQHK